MSRKNANLQSLGAIETETILQELDCYNVQQLESINRNLNDKMIDKMLGVQKKNRIGANKANQIYERFMDYEQKKKRNKLNRKMMSIDKENRIRRSHSKSRFDNGVTHKGKFLDRVDHMIETRQKKIAEKQIRRVIEKERELQKECTFAPVITKDHIYE